MNRTISAIAAGTAALGFAIAALAGSSDTATQRTHRDLQSRLDSISDLKVKEYFATAPKTDKERQEYEAMEFLYAYMPLPDLINKTPDYYREAVRAALRAREEMPWGKDVPEREFRHFVLPARVNNEDLDSARVVFYEELKDRVKGLSMKEAILEVNHWCHEKVTYQPSDGRTSSPLSAVSQAIGRCGEESTFAVTALRSVGIPARQVYTPRWAHTDDNHAWVEAWADGQWWFLGACEPEPILNLAWFNSPASRGMLMTTKAYGYYDGPEEQIDRTAVNTTINVTSNYAPVSNINVIVTDRDGKPVEDASVRFSLYNYAEYFPVAIKRSDKEGLASLTAGAGDMLVWATDGERFGMVKANSSMTQPVKVTLDMDGNYEGSEEFDIVPPQPSAVLPKPTPEETAINENRKAYEDSLRQSYTATFATREQATAFAAKNGIEPEKAVKILTESRGNHTNIERFLESLPTDDRDRAVAMLLEVSEKDRRDIPMEVVADRLLIPVSDSPLYAAYILNPRIEAEGLVPFVAGFLQDMPEKDRTRYRNNPQEWVSWTAANIASDGVWNPGRLRTSPAGVWRTRKADALSRDIFFVAAARAMGIPARIDQVTGKTQWHNGIDWIDADFGSAATEEAAVTPSGEVRFVFTPTGRITDPTYYSQFSLSKIENGTPRLLDFDETATLSQISASHPRLDTGQYILTTGQRMADGSVLARSTFFTLREGEKKEVPMVIRQDTTGVQVIGSFNAEDLYKGRDGKEHSIISTTGRGYYTLIYGKPNHEPTSHVLNEISAIADKFEGDGRKIMLIYENSDMLDRAQLERFPSLPSNVVAGADIDGAILAELTENLGLTPGDLPIVVVADTFNRVVYLSQGYTIGSGDRLIDVLSRVE